MSGQSIAFVGAGNMAASLIGGLIADGNDPATLRVSDPNSPKLAELKKIFNIMTSQDNGEIAKDAKVIILCVKPQDIKVVCDELAAIVAQTRPLVISVAAGIKTDDLQTWLGLETAIVRCMPNTPALVRSGATGLYANTKVNKAQHEMAEKILRSVGVTVWLSDESLLNTVTALSGSGPAYFFYVMEALVNAAIEQGLDPEQARLLTIQTALGAAHLALAKPESLEILRKQVTSRGGTTEAAMNVLQGANLSAIFSSALAAGAKRSEELSQIF